MEKQTKRKARLFHSHKLIEDFPNLFNQIHQYANKDVIRIEFLGDISKIFYDFIGCDTVEICMEEDDTQYYWKATYYPEESSSYKLMPRIDYNADKIEKMIVIDPTHPDFCISVLEKQLSPSLPCVTKSGSFWTNDTDNPLVSSSSKKQSSHFEIHLGNDHKSVAAIPFKIDETNSGILLIKCLEKFHFTENEIKFYGSVAQTLGLTVAYRRAQVSMQERVKQLTCLYGISQLVSHSSYSLEQLLQRSVELLLPSLRFPKLAMVMISFDDRKYFTKDYENSSFKRRAKLLVNDEERGFIEISYRERKPGFVTDPFLEEEERLLDTVVKEIELIIEEHESEEYKAKLQEQIRHADRLATIGQLAAGVAHELNEPLLSILGYSQLLRKSSDIPQHLIDDLDTIISASLHSREIVKKLLIFSRQIPTKMSEANLNQVVGEGLYFLESRFTKEGIELEVSLDPDMPVITADPSQLHQILVNLVVNAMQSIQDKGKITIKTVTCKNDVLLIIEDTGVGMTDEILKQIFLPFFTTKDVGQGTGLGLSVVHGIVTSHGGTINVESEVGKGSRFEVKIPILRRKVINNK